MAVCQGTAVEHADRAATAWRTAVHAQRRATSEHSDFYRLAAEIVDTLRVLGSLSSLLTRQVDEYDTGRDLYDDSGTISARERLDLAVGVLQDLTSALDTAERRASQFHSDVGHIGGCPAGDER